MSEITHNASDVFGISRDLPLNYVTRPTADDFLIENLTRDKHLVIYGSSKQGKTSLRKHCLNSDDYIVVHCSNKWSISDLNSAILKKAGFEVTQSTAKTVSGKSKILAKIKASVFGVGAEAGTEQERQTSESTTTHPLELDPEDVNDIINCLNQITFNKYIVLEDFHYLSTEAQKDFSVALKAFHEESPYCFIIIGVWLEENRLTVYNGDLTGRVVSIDADLWKEHELQQVISDGEAMLNVSFTDDFKDHLIQNCFGSVYIVQESCYQCCQRYGVNRTHSGDVLSIGSEEDASEIVEGVVNLQTGRFNSFITQFSDGFQTTELQMHRWLLHPVLTSNIENLKTGIRYSDIRKDLMGHHPAGKELNPGNITQALQSTASLQAKKEIKPIILDYDQTNLRLNVVDTGFLIWLNKQDRDELLALAGVDEETNN
ncbi:hypothetical protein FCL40_01160 [Ferrimonas sediminicola]|uniref:AAA domain-containing protein n=1 Tax=Ferrimonas sediminicola TaxID=2569538 RepID=A0A4U1BJ59_9GAMM|nr:hypothetical protein [Ferrimonas sediminicola]TKB51195.1 hypothetical protein FCL40_01160 [Ferrimonas sediminicola]